MLDREDRITECTRSNIFFIKDGQLHTPDLQHRGISGVMRGHILECARNNDVSVFIRDIHKDEAGLMDEAFVCNSLIGVWPVARLGDRIRFRLNKVLAIRNWTAEYTLEPAHA
jgi:4-amino-4-deoxychorismate lyase